MSEQLKILAAALAIVLGAPAVVLTYAAVSEPAPVVSETPPAVSAAPAAGTTTTTPAAQTAPQPPPPPPPPPSNGSTPDEDRDQEQPANPKEVRDVLRQIKEQLRELKSLEKQAKKASADAVLAKALEIRSALTVSQTALKAPSPTHDVLQEFWDARYWEEINPLRAQIQLPKELKDISKQITKVEKKLKRARYKKLGPELLGLLTTKAAEVSKAATDARALFDQGNYEDAQEALQLVHEEVGPWDIESVADRLTDLYKEIKGIRDEEISTQLDEVLSPIIDLVKEGDLREANNTLNEVFNDTMQVVFQASKIRGTGRARDAFDDRLEKLQELLEKKLEQGESKSGAPTPQPPAEFK